MAESGEQKETARKQSENPPNFVTLVQLRERWLKKKAEEEEERIRKQQQEERAKEEEERRRKLEEAKELANSEALCRNFGTSSHCRQNRSRRTLRNVVATVGFSLVVDEGDKDDEEGERRLKLKQGKERGNSKAVRWSSVTSSHPRENRDRRTPSNAAMVAFAQVVDGGNEDDEAKKRRKKKGYRREKERREAKRARAKEKVMEEGKQPVVPEAASKESEGIEVMIESQRENDNVVKQISNRVAGIGNGSVPARKPKKKSKVKIGNVGKEGTELGIEEKLGELSIEEENGGGYGFETRNGVSDNVDKGISKTGAEIGNASIPARKPQRKSKVNMEFREKIGNVEKVGSKVVIEEKMGEFSIEEKNGGGFETKNGVSDNVEKQISKGAEWNGSVRSRTPQRKSKVNTEFQRKIGKNVEEEECKVEIEGNLGKLSIEEENGGFETKNGVSNGHESLPSRKPQRKSKVNTEFRRKIGKNVEKEESKLEIEGKLGELSVEEGNGEFETKNGINHVKYSRGHGRLNRSGRQNDESNERRYGRFHGLRGRGNSGRYRGGYGSLRMENNGGFKVGVWVRKEDTGSGVEGIVKSSDFLLKATSN